MGEEFERLFKLGATSTAKLWERVKDLKIKATRKEVDAFIKARKSDSRFKKPAKVQERGTAGYVAANAPWAQVGMDVMFEAKDKRLWLIIVDIYSGYIKAVRLTSRTGKAIRSAVTRAKIQFKPGAQVFTDREPAWTENVTNDRQRPASWLTELGLTQVFVEHQSHAERAIRSIRESLRDRDEPMTYPRVQETVDILNATPHRITGQRPDKTVNDSQPLELAEVQYKRRMAVAKRQKPVEILFSAGDRVRVLAQQGPYTKKSRGDDIPDRVFTVTEVLRNYAMVTADGKAYKVKLERLRQA